MTVAASDGAANDASGPVLELAEVSKVFPATPPVTALDRVSLTVGSGELVGLVGASGSGKSTLLNIVGTLDRPSSGEVFVEGTATSHLSDAALSGLRATRIGFVFQQFHLLEQASALTNVAHGLLYLGMPPRERQRRAAAALERVGLADRMHHGGAKLSGGERQRVAIARAIVADPAIVLADEPTGNLDSTTSESIVQLLLNLNADGATVLVITHDNELAERLPRRVVLRDGRVIADDATASASTDPARGPR